MKLRAILSLQTIQKLRRIAGVAGLSPDPSGNKTALIDLLCGPLSKPEAVAARLDALTPEQREFATALAAEGGELLEAEAVGELSNGFVRPFRALLCALSEAGLVFQDSETLGPDCPLVGIPDPLLRSIPVPQADQGRLRQVMKTTSIGLLRAFARDLGALSRDAQRPFVVQAIRAHLLNPEHLKAYMNGLSEEKRAILSRILKVDEITPEEIREGVGGASARELDEMLWKTPLFFSPLPARLRAARGQAPSSARQAGRQAGGDRSRPNAAIRLATDLRQTMQAIADSQGGHLQSRPEEALKEMPEPPAQVRNNTPYLLHDLATLLGFIEQRRPRLLKRGGLAKAELARQCYRGDTDPGYPEFLTLFTEASGMVHPEGGFWRLSENVGERLEEAIQMQKALLAFWQETERWNEWTAARPASSARRDRIDALKSLRQEVLKGLRTCPKDCWVAYPRFYRLLVGSSEPFRHLAGHPATGRALAAGGTTADELLRRMFRGALTWMGLTVLGNPDAFALPLHREERASFRVTPLGRALLEGEGTEAFRDAAPPTNPDARFVLQPNLEILSPPDLPYARFIALFGLADLKSIDVMTHFQITREAFQRAMNRGASGDAIREFLKTNSATGLPDIVEALIEECESKHGEIEIGPASGYLTVAREALLDELYAQTQIAVCLGLRVSPTEAVLKPDTKPEALIQLLHKQGYMPRLMHALEDEKNGRHQVVQRPGKSPGYQA